MLAPPSIAHLVTCEHGGNRIPVKYSPLFHGHRELLATHRGYDPGALAMARALARAFDAPLVASRVSRLLVELNRSPGREFRYSPIMRDAPADVRSEIFRRYYLPYRRQVERIVQEATGAGRHVLHISSHSFTPVLDGIARSTDVGLLYDPERGGERDLCIRWQAALAARAPHWLVRRNYPYLGRSDGLTSSLRRQFPQEIYTGIELEINQKHVLDGRSIAAEERAAVVLALRDALASWQALQVLVEERDRA